MNCVRGERDGGRKLKEVFVQCSHCIIGFYGLYPALAMSMMES